MRGGCPASHWGRRLRPPGPRGSASCRPSWALPWGQTAFLPEARARGRCPLHLGRGPVSAPTLPSPPTVCFGFHSASSLTTVTAGAPGCSRGSGPSAHSAPAPKTRRSWGPARGRGGGEPSSRAPASTSSLPPRKLARGTRHLVLGAAPSFPCARASASACGHVYTGAHVCTRVAICTRVHTCAHVCVRGCVHICTCTHVVRVCVRVHVCVCLPSTPSRSDAQAGGPGRPGLACPGGPALSATLPAPQVLPRAGGPCGRAATLPGAGPELPAGWLCVSGQAAGWPLVPGTGHG